MIIEERKREVDWGGKSLLKKYSQSGLTTLIERD